MFAYGRNMYSLSRAGYYPKFLSLTGKRQTPWVALRRRRGDRLRRPRRARRARALDAEGAGAVAGAIVLNIAVWGAVLAYLLQMVVVRDPAPQVPEREAPVPQPVGRARRGRRGRDRGAHLPRVPPQPDVPAGDHRDRRRLRRDAGHLRALGSPPPRSSRPRRSTPCQRRTARRPAGGGLRRRRREPSCSRPTASTSPTGSSRRRRAAGRGGAPPPVRASRVGGRLGGENERGDPARTTSAAIPRA